MGKEKAKSKRPRRPKPWDVTPRPPRRIVTPAEHWHAAYGGTTADRGRTIQFPRYVTIAPVPAPPETPTTTHQVGLTLRDERGREVSFTRTIGAGVVQVRSGKITGCNLVEVSEQAVRELIEGLERLLASKAPKA